MNSPASTRCGVGSEDSRHVLWSCKKNNFFWCYTSFVAHIQAHGRSFVDLFQLAAKELSHDNLDYFTCCAWKI